jgi:hypothetical protein
LEDSRSSAWTRDSPRFLCSRVFICRILAHDKHSTLIGQNVILYRKYLHIAYNYYIYITRYRPDHLKEEVPESLLNALKYLKYRTS